MSSNVDFSITAFLNKVQLLVKPCKCEFSDYRGFAYNLFSISRSVCIEMFTTNMCYNVGFCVLRPDSIYKPSNGATIYRIYVELDDYNFTNSYDLNHIFDIDDYPYSYFNSLYDFLYYLKYNFISDYWGNSTRIVYSRNNVEVCFKECDVSFGNIVKSSGIGEEYLKLYGK